MTHYEIITKLIGSVQPSGDASIDPQRKESLLKTIELVDQLLNDIRSAAVSKDRYEASMKEIGYIAHNYLSNLELDLGEYLNREVVKVENVKVETVNTEPQHGMRVRIVTETPDHIFKLGEIVTLGRHYILYNDWRATGKNDYCYIKRNDFEIIENHEKSNL
jgi:hypothetical protein